MFHISTSKLQMHVLLKVWQDRRAWQDNFDVTPNGGLAAGCKKALKDSVKNTSCRKIRKIIEEHLTISRLLIHVANTKVWPKNFNSNIDYFELFEEP